LNFECGKYLVSACNLMRKNFFYQPIMSKNFVQVLLPLALDEPFTYLDEIGVEEGDVVKVSFGKKEIWGVVVSCRLLVVGLPLEKIKKILEKNSRVKFSREQLKFIEAIASYNLASRGLVLRAFIGILNSDKVKKIPQGLMQVVDAEKFSLKKLSERQEEIVGKILFSSSFPFLSSAPPSFPSSLAQRVIPSASSLARSAEDLRNLDSEPQLPRSSAFQAKDDVGNKEAKDGGGSKNDKDGGGSKNDKDGGGSKNDKGARLVAENVFLLDGVTGSGKTEIYFALIAKILEKNSAAQILILLPEIALTSQLLLRFEEQFGFKPALWHSKISKKEKREIFYGVVDGSVRVLIGARSALLLPFKNLQLIVIDEEHDSSFKQEDVFNFHARDMAIVKAKAENFPVILSSATPALETYANAVCGKYQHFILSQKFGQKNEIELVDLRREKLDSGNFLSQKLRAGIAENFANKKQTLLFLNRRGYAPVTLCKSCGKKYECADCDFHLVLHKSRKKLICHHCGHQENLNHACKFCGEQDALISVGVGVEKIEEEVKNLFPEARIALVTSDNVTNFSDVDKLVKKILAREIDIIIGTQMIAKGHDFPDLTLVGIVDADGLLYSSELRALEKTFQILTQVIGRAGRRDIVGKILIQTHNPQNFIFEKILQDDKKSFYEFEIKNRQALNLPPFARFAKFEISSFVEADARNFSKKLIQNFPADEKVELFGPAPAPLQRLKNRHHFLVHLKVAKKVNLQKLIADVMKSLDVPNSVRVRIDVDPV
jgi:primosomal protein N' (replication factor Y)